MFTQCRFCDLAHRRVNRPLALFLALKNQVVDSIRLIRVKLQAFFQRLSGCLILPPGFLQAPDVVERHGQVFYLICLVWSGILISFRRDGVLNNCLPLFNSGFCIALAFKRQSEIDTGLGESRAKRQCLLESFNRINQVIFSKKNNAEIEPGNAVENACITLQPGAVECSAQRGM